MNSCPLCENSAIDFYFQDKRRQYFQCTACKLVFADPETIISSADEKAIYDYHENDLEDEGYIRFLNRFATPFSQRLQTQSQGLDFGCGPAPALAKLLENQGHNIALYDKFYANNLQVLNKQYDFICCTEAIEHFHQPAIEWRLFLSLLKPNGLLGIMTKLVIDKERFANWHYKNDATHVSFFSKETFEFLANRDNLSLEFTANDVIFLSKKESN